MAGTTRLELATSCVTGMRSNQLNYVPDLEASKEAGRRFLFLASHRPRHRHPRTPRLSVEWMVGGIRIERMTFCL